ncbi:MAG: Gfo/Idh/MocA family oxidoreductase [Kiritimatiellae bacterium]|nr:Gfo/Idh/MocA family oxidoreductase [Kiritimatiellia bacterium]MDD5521295.1 Gfo/Idh/MocA family oxidoreductase [Kiritimatiellia bacterium]
MNNVYKVVVVGMGKRGKHHATAFNANPRFKVVGICDIDKSRADAAAPQLGNPQVETDAATLASAVKPDVFCFCTLPSIRLDLIKLGIKSRVKLIAFEKPVAMSSSEAMKIKKLIDKSGVKAVVSHQHRYGEHYRKVKEIIASGALGRIHTVYGTASGWMMHMLSHLIDYMRWYNNEAEANWVMGQAAGLGKFADVHSSPDYIGGFIQFTNGVRGIVECGAGAPDVPEVDYWWRKCRIGAQGTDGYAEVLTGGGWRAVTKNGASSGSGCMNYDNDMPPYIQEMADWLDDDRKVHSCNFTSAYKGFEIMMGLCRSVIEGGQIALPLTKGKKELKKLSKTIPEKKVMVSTSVNAKEYGV